MSENQQHQNTDIKVQLESIQSVNHCQG